MKKFVFFDSKGRDESVVRSDFRDRVDGTGTSTDFKTTLVEDPRFQYPIPLAETNNNPNFEQNPGY